MDAAPAVLQALANDLRWQLVSVLSRSDRRVKELVAEVGQRQNLVSYHLRLLEQSGLVDARRSSADARDVYYHLNTARLGSDLRAVGRALYPPLSSGVRGQQPERAGHRPTRVLFICTGNSARSLIAEALLRKMAGTAVEVRSAGPEPAGVHPLTGEVLEELGFKAAGIRSKALDEVLDRPFDYVITLCDVAREHCPQIRGGPEFIHWSLPDPAAVLGSVAQRRAAFRQTADELQGRIQQLVGLNVDGRGIGGNWGGERDG